MFDQESYTVQQRCAGMHQLKVSVHNILQLHRQQPFQPVGTLTLSVARWVSSCNRESGTSCERYRDCMTAASLPPFSRKASSATVARMARLHCCRPPRTDWLHSGACGWYLDWLDLSWWSQADRYSGNLYDDVKQIVGGPGQLVGAVGQLAVNLSVLEHVYDSEHGLGLGSLLVGFQLFDHRLHFE